jgi:hypothetical protein
MLERIHLKNVGPAAEMKMDLAPRLNLVTGDNGLGKSFLLDVAWWVLTRTWAREMVVPMPGAKAEIAYEYTKRTRGSYSFASTYEPARERWTVKPSRPPIPGLILYAQVDGGFSVWDPARNYWTEDALDRPNAFHFSPAEVWGGNAHCNGLLEDWALWQAGKEPVFETLKHVLDALSASPNERLQPGTPRKLTVSDPKRYPTLRMPYGQDVSVTHASAGMRRVIALAYLLTWAWQEHVESAGLRGEKPTREIVFLVDEIEAHLHPEWQRRVVPALLNVMKVLTGKHDAKVQLVAATHSPLVLASVEPLFDVDADKLFVLEMKNRVVSLNEEPWAKQGDVINWLVSDTFGLRQARSVEAERAIEAAEALMRGEAKLPTGLTSKEAIHAELRRLLPGHDPFWPRWLVESGALAGEAPRRTARRPAKARKAKRS